MDPAEEAKALADYEAAGIKLHAAGAIYFPKDEDDDIRSKFEYCKRAGISVIVAGDPAPPHFAAHGEVREGIRHSDRHPQPWAGGQGLAFPAGCVESGEESSIRGWAAASISAMRARGYGHCRSHSCHWAAAFQHARQGFDGLPRQGQPGRGWARASLPFREIFEALIKRIQGFCRSGI